MKVLITGGSGRLGKYLVNEFSGCLAPTHSELDVSDYNSVKTYLEMEKPDVILHCAAWVDVRGCEGDHDKAWKVNVGGTENVANAIRELGLGSRLVYVSTACVFHGDRGGYTEEDAPNPINYYGLTKVAGEQVVKSVPNSLIIRTDFVERAKWRFPKAFTDRYSTCVFSDTLASAVKKVVDDGVVGLIHLTGSRRISHFDLARLTTPDVGEMTIADLEGLVVPMDQSLKSVKGFDNLPLE